MPKHVCVEWTWHSFQLLKEVRRFEILRHGVVQPRDHLVYGLLPALFGVLPALDRAEELSKGLLNHVSEVWWNLE